jgi:streptogramin lyase
MQSVRGTKLGQVYWAGTGFGNNGVYSQPIGVAPTGLNFATLASSASMNAVGLALQGGNIYYADAAGGSVSRVPTSGISSPTPLATASGPIDLVADLSNVYWIDGSGATIMKVPTTGGAATQFAAGGNANAIAEDAASVYWTNSSGIMRAPK